MLALPTVVQSFPVPLLQGNSKLGKTVWHWSLPAIQTCPGRSELCSKLCYAMKGHYFYANVRDREAVNEQMRHEAGWWRRVVSQISLHNIREVRIHSSGDFDIASYTEDWLRIISSKPETKFYAYTRSWSVPELLPILDRMSKLPNMRLWHSCDKDTGIPPRRKLCPRAYLSSSDADFPKYKVDLIFRNDRRVKQVTLGGVMVCPAERLRSKRRPDGTKPNKVTCAQCQICFDPQRLQWLADYNQQSAAKSFLPVLETV